MVFKEFSILLSDTPVVWNTWTPSQNHHYINANPTSACNTGFTTDTAVWYEVKGEFIAQGGEEYLTIGFFHSITSADTLMLSSGYDKQAYYFIDDVSLWYCGPDTIPKPTELPLPIIPNVFTPNGDGFNDLFQYAKSEGWNLQTCIRNRWGQVVYEGKNDHWWDGNINGQPAATGVYYYTVTASNQFGQHEMFNGVVTVLR